MADKLSGEQLRADIDAGRTGDKVAFPDPAAAPLGTDAEAGGTPTSFPPERRANVSREGRNWSGMAVYIALTGGIALLALLLVWYAT